jgi:hypothetical protein
MRAVMPDDSQHILEGDRRLAVRLAGRPESRELVT